MERHLLWTEQVFSNICVTCRRFLMYSPQKRQRHINLYWQGLSGLVAGEPKGIILILLSRATLVPLLSLDLCRLCVENDPRRKNLPQSNQGSWPPIQCTSHLTDGSGASGLVIPCDSAQDICFSQLRPFSRQNSALGKSDLASTLTRHLPAVCLGKVVYPHW